MLRSVALTAPAVFQFTAPSSPDRHREALAVFHGVSTTDPSITAIPDSAIGAHLFEAIARFLDGLEQNLDREAWVRTIEGINKELGEWKGEWTVERLVLRKGVSWYGGGESVWVGGCGRGRPRESEDD